MYKYNRIGPWPSRDISQEVASSTVKGQIGSYVELKPYVSIGNGSKGQFHLYHAEEFGIGLRSTQSFGLVLDTPEMMNIGTDNYMVEYSVTYAGLATQNSMVMPYVGLIEDGYQEGWNASNSVKKWCCLPGVSLGFLFSENGQVLINNLQAENISNQNLIVGAFGLNFSSDQEESRCYINISANYATTEIQTYDKLR